MAVVPVLNANTAGGRKTVEKPGNRPQITSAELHKWLRTAEVIVKLEPLLPKAVGPRANGVVTEDLCV